MNPKGIILTGGPNSCYEDGAPTCTKEFSNLVYLYLVFAMAHSLCTCAWWQGWKAPVREYGKTETFVDKSSALFSDVSEKTIVWMSHFDYISQIAPGFKIVAHTADCPVAAADVQRRIFMQSSSPRGSSYSGRNQDASQLCSWSMRMCRNMEDGCICREYN